MAKVPVHEVRRLLLPVETVVDAVLQLDRDAGGKLSHGTLVEVVLESPPEPGLSLAAKLPGALTAERRKFPLPAIAAAIINWCRQSRIPLPRQGKKTLEIVPEGFAFTVETSAEVPRWHQAVPAGMVRRSAQQPADEARPETPPHVPNQDGSGDAST
ncbi:MAG: hypothetical protein ACREUC_10110 [Steroidobacteraceae bacterium]